MLKTGLLSILPQCFILPKPDKTIYSDLHSVIRFYNKYLNICKFATIKVELKRYMVVWRNNTWYLRERSSTYTHRFSRTVQTGFPVQSRPSTFYAKNEVLCDHSDIIIIYDIIIIIIIIIITMFSLKSTRRVYGFKWLETKLNSLFRREDLFI